MDVGFRELPKVLRNLTIEYSNIKQLLVDLHIVSCNGLLLKFAKEQTEEICLEAVKNNGLALEFVENQTEEICLEAVKNNGLALEFVENQTEELCLEAVKNNGFAILQVENKTRQICLEAIKQNESVSDYVDEDLLKCESFTNDNFIIGKCVVFIMVIAYVLF
jgi:hypothetical protein